MNNEQILTKERLYSFEDYCDYNDGTDNRYELVDGRLEVMNPPTVRHFLIAKYLEKIFDREINRKNLPWVCLKEAGVRTGWRKSRLTDLFIIPKEAALELLDRSAIFQTPPQLVVEIVSPDSIARDYRYKRSEYAALEIPEYWIVDPKENKVTVLILEEGFYEDSIFIGESQIISRQFNELNLTAKQILDASL